MATNNNLLGGGLRGINYTGTNATNPPNIWFRKTDPTIYTIANYALGDWWINTVNETVFMLLSVAATEDSGGYQQANWVEITTATGTLTELNGDTGSATPTDGEITIAGGNNITTSATGSTVTVDLDNTIIVSGNISTTAGNINANSGLVTADGMVVSTSGITCTGGISATQNITSSAGSISAATNITAVAGALISGGGLSVTSGTSTVQNLRATQISFDAGTNNLANYIAPTSFTPTLTFGGGSTGITYLNRSGSYTRIGNIVTFYVFIELTSKGSSTGNMQIAGIPVGSVETTPLSLRVLNMTFVNPLQARITASNMYIEDSIAGTILTDAAFNNNSLIMLAGSIII